MIEKRHILTYSHHCQHNLIINDPVPASDNNAYSADEITLTAAKAFLPIHGI